MTQAMFQAPNAGGNSRQNSGSAQSDRPSRRSGGNKQSGNRNRNNADRSEQRRQKQTQRKLQKETPLAAFVMVCGHTDRALAVKTQDLVWCNECSDFRRVSKTLAK